MKSAAVLGAALALAGCVAVPVHEPTMEPVAPPDPPRDVPRSRRPLAILIAEAPELSRFRALAAAGGLDRLLAGRAPVTLLAPTDAAFARLPPGTVEALLQPGNRPSLLHLLRFWVVPDVASLPAAGDGAVRLPTLEGEPVLVDASSGAAALRDAVGRRGYTVRRTTASDGMLVELNGIIAPRSIEPGAGAAIRQ